MHPDFPFAFSQKNGRNAMVLHEAATELVSQLTKDGEDRNDDEEEREREPSEEYGLLNEL